MSKCFLFVEEETILSAMCGNASFFVIWLAKRCFCGSSQHIRRCSHVNFGHLLSIVLTFARGGAVLCSLSVCAIIVLCLCRRDCKFSSDKRANSSLQSAICRGFPFGCKDRSFRANVCADKEAEERESEESEEGGT